MQAAFGNCYPLVCFSYASWSGTFNPPHPKQNCTHWKISSAFPLYFMIFCLTFCLLLYEMYGLTTTFLLFFFSPTPSTSVTWNQVFSFTCLFEKPGNLGQIEEQDMLRQRNCCGRAGNWEKA